MTTMKDWVREHFSNEYDKMVRFHPRAMKLLRKRKNFIVVACDEPYFRLVYMIIRAYERRRARWTAGDEERYLEATE